MKKKLEAELISIAHRILKLKNKSDLLDLHRETQKLYEKLSILKFVEEQLGDVKPTIGRSEIEDKITAAFENVADEIRAEETESQPDKIEEPREEQKPEEKEPETEPTEETAPEISNEPVTAEQESEEAAVAEAETSEEEAQDQTEEITQENTEAAVEEFDVPAEIAWEIPANETAAAESAETKTAETEVKEPENAEPEAPFKPSFELSFDTKETTIKEDAKDEFKNANTQITFEDILGSTYVDPVFVKPEDLQKERETPKSDNVIPISRNFSDAPVISLNKTDDRPYSLNDRLSKGITIGLNDRVAFMKHLFANSSEDYNRVLSQLMTFDTFEDAKTFIDDMVKPDYNNWAGKEEYADRFMEIVEKRFS